MPDTTLSGHLSTPGSTPCPVSQHNDQLPTPVQSIDLNSSDSLQQHAYKQKPPQHEPTSAVSAQPSSVPQYQQPQPQSTSQPPPQQQQQQQHQPVHAQNVTSISNLINPPQPESQPTRPNRSGDVSMPDIGGSHHQQVDTPSRQHHVQSPTPRHTPQHSQAGTSRPAQPQGQPQPQAQSQAHAVPKDANKPTQNPAQQTIRQTKGKYSLNDFSFQRTLGTGSFGRVHLVQSRHNQRFYAIKVLKKEQVVRMKQVEHTNDERRMLQRVKHPFLVTLWGTFQDPRNLYMVMDFVEGGELFSLLRKSTRFPNPVAKFYAAEVTLALEYLHNLNIIYRDLKPENLLLDRHGHLKITDFGFAKEVRDVTWTLCGTPDYLAPEVVSSKGYNKSVDWWSLGILIFEMLCGFTPFWDGGSPMKIYENILRGKVKYPHYMNPDAQDLLSQLITPDLSKRLGNLVGGAQDVKNHAWFREVTWDRLLRKDIDAPYVPPVKGGSGDASQFDTYPEETERYGLPGDDPYGHLFSEF
ncbi:camp-dependent protein kinase catalytic subunit [Ascosphaera acerosa]|nr:camp-dependent protein kinase catalytic subunit [Ascosphaera acerosa]